MVSPPRLGYSDLIYISIVMRMRIEYPTDVHIISGILLRVKYSNLLTFLWVKLLTF